MWHSAIGFGFSEQDARLWLEAWDDLCEVFPWLRVPPRAAKGSTAFGVMAALYLPKDWFLKLMAWRAQRRAQPQKPNARQQSPYTPPPQPPPQAPTAAPGETVTRQAGVAMATNGLDTIVIDSPIPDGGRLDFGPG